MLIHSHCGRRPIVERLPYWSRPIVEKFRETGEYADHVAEPIEAEKATRMSQELANMLDEVIAADNTKTDLNPSQGIIEANDGWIGEVRAEFEVDCSGFGQGFATYNDGKNLIFVEHTPEVSDYLVVSHPRARDRSDDGAVHLDDLEPAQSYTTKPKAP